MQPIGFANAELIQLPISPKGMLIFGPIDSQFPERILSEDQLNFKVSGFNKMMVNNLMNGCLQIPIIGIQTLTS